jgi:hypothetical protein
MHLLQANIRVPFFKEIIKSEPITILRYLVRLCFAK